jgi:hypothetical protein
MVKIQKKRSSIDRRAGKDRRRAHHPDYSINGGVERRSFNERRSGKERRKDWVAADEWVSVFVGE